MRYARGETSKHIMDILCKGAHNVEVFTMGWWKSSDCYWESMGEFFQLNKSSLSYVAFEERYSNHKVDEMVQILLQGSSLKEIGCVGPPPEKLLKALEKRGIQCRGWDGSIYYSD